MKIVCDSCGTKYSIADDKVRGKVFKIRCKKCAHIIIVRGNEDQPAGSPSTAELDALQPETASSQPSSFDQKETRVFDYSGFDGAEAPAAQGYGGGEPVWHCVIEREQVGPMTEDELRERLRSGEIDQETYVWREGFGDWARLATVGELAHVLADQQQTVAEGTERRPVPDTSTRNGSGLHYGSVSSARSAPDLFATDGGRGGEAPQPLFTAPAGSEDDLFGMPGRTGSAPHEEPEPDPAPAPRARRAPATEPEPSAMGGGLEAAGEQRMTGQRNENSVLFSLNNLSALAQSPAPAAAAGAPKPSPMQNGGTTEGSGLIDIRAMAATTLGIDQRRAQAAGGASSRPPTDEELPPIGFSPVAASPLLMPSAPKPTVPPWVWAVVGGAFLLLAGAVVLAFRVFSTPTPVPTAPPMVAAPAPAPMPVAAAPTAAAPAAAPPTAAAPAVPPAKEERVVAAKENRGDKKEKKGNKGEKVAKADRAADKADKPAAALPPTPTSADPPAPKEPAEKPKKGKRGDDLDELLNGATGGKKSHTPKAAEPEEAPRKKEPAVDPNLPSQLSQAQVMSGIRRVKGTVQGCFDKYKEQGLVQVKITIAPSGGVTASTVTGKFAGTQTGDCVGTAVKAARFDKFSGSPMAITYPFMLR